MAHFVNGFAIGEIFQNEERLLWNDANLYKKVMQKTAARFAVREGAFVVLLKAFFIAPN